MKKLILKSLGPGLLFAGAAVGVSHLVQSTRAGADLVLVYYGHYYSLRFLNILFFNLVQAMLLLQEKLIRRVSKIRKRCF